MTQWNSTLPARKAPMWRGSPLRQDARYAPPKLRKAALPRLGKKGLLWEATRKRLKVRFEAAGITRCEICGNGYALGFAHRFKRRNITTQTELETCALLCNEHHDELEILPESEMGKRVDALIAARERSV